MFILRLLLLLHVCGSLNTWNKSIGPNGEDTWQSTSDFIPQQSRSFGTIQLRDTMSVEFDFIWNGRTNYPREGSPENFFRIGHDAKQSRGCGGESSHYPSFWLKHNEDIMCIKISSGTACENTHYLSSYGNLTKDLSYHIKIAFNDTRINVEITNNEAPLFNDDTPDWSQSWMKQATQPLLLGDNADIWFMSNRFTGTRYNVGNGTFSNIIIQSSSFATQNPTVFPTEKPTTSPTLNPINSPTLNPINSPTLNPSVYPSIAPTHSPSIYPSLNPSKIPTETPTMSSTKNPSLLPTSKPSMFLTNNPTNWPTINPTVNPSTSTTEIATVNATTRNPNVTPRATQSTTVLQSTETAEEITELESTIAITEFTSYSTNYFQKPANWILKTDSTICPDGTTDLEDVNPRWQKDNYCQQCPDGTAGMSGICEKCAMFKQPNHNKTDCIVVWWLWVTISLAGAMASIVGICSFCFVGCGKTYWEKKYLDNEKQDSDSYDHDENNENNECDNIIHEEKEQEQIEVSQHQPAISKFSISECPWFLSWKQKQNEHKELEKTIDEQLMEESGTCSEMMGNDVVINIDQVQRSISWAVYH